jgi:prevent-host-death family protein
VESVGVRELKANLSRYVRRVKAGARLTVTDRGRAVALLSPLDEPPSVAWVHSLVSEGHAQWAGGKPAGLAPRVPSRGKPASVMVLQDRR